MDQHPNAALMRRSYEALATGDIQVLKDTATPGFTFEVGGTSAISGTAHSVEEAAGEFQRSMELTAGTMQMDQKHLLADDSVGIVIIEVTASRPDGRVIEQQVIHEWRFDDGKVTGIREWIWDQAGDVEFWA